jgi:hypothetical protein
MQQVFSAGRVFSVSSRAHSTTIFFDYFKKVYGLRLLSINKPKKMSFDQSNLAYAVFERCVYVSTLIGLSPFFARCFSCERLFCGLRGVLGEVGISVHVCFVS